jgi:hypothetical protein
MGKTFSCINCKNKKEPIEICEGTYGKVVPYDIVNGKIIDREPDSDDDEIIDCGIILKGKRINNIHITLT